MPETVVFDSFALLAFLRDEPGADLVEEILNEAARRADPVWMTEINYAEVKYILLRKHGEDRWAAFARAISGIPIRFVSVGRRISDRAADLKANHKLSLADACTAALAMELEASVVTGDREFKALSDRIEVVWLR
ncbi:MAG: PIN domain-containing protein [Synoicihabitans sp.]